MEEIEQVVSVYAAIVQGSAASSNSAAKKLLEGFTAEALLLLQQLNYALTHLNHLASAFEPITAEGRTMFEQDPTSSSVKTPSDAVDQMRRPFLARLIHRLYCLSSTLLSALIDICGAETVLFSEPEDWQVSQVLIVPMSLFFAFIPRGNVLTPTPAHSQHSKVVLGKPASLGMLL